MALIGATLDYGSMVYSSASKTQLARIEAIQNQALRICCGAIRSSPVSSLNVETGVMPLGMRRIKLRMRYWANIKGQLENHPVKNVLSDCWEYNYKKLSSFGWFINEEAREIIKDVNIATCVVLPAIPPWFFPMPFIDIQLHKDKQNEENILDSVKVQDYIDHIYYSAIQIYTDGSKDPDSGTTSAAVFIPQFKVNILKRTSDHISIFTSELIAIILALQWVEEVQPIRSVICTDSLSAIESLASGISTARQDLIYEILQSLFRIRHLGIIIHFLWIPAHTGVAGNEEVDSLAKQAIKFPEVDINIALSKTEIKSIIAKEIRKKWQKEWDSGNKGRHLYKIQGTVGFERRNFGNRRKDVIISRMRIGHCLLNQSMVRIGKHQTGYCDKCSSENMETVEHVLLKCEAYARERFKLFQALREMEMEVFSIKALLGNGPKQFKIYEEVFHFLKDTHLSNRI